MKRALASLLLLLAAGCRRAAESPRYEGAPVIIISIDTLRADHLPMFGYRGVETPALDALRRDSILYRNAFSHVPLTLPSHVSMLTGLLPPANEVRNNIGYPFDRAKHPTIAAMLGQRGYDTGAAVSAYVLRGATGIGPDFQFYDDNIEVKGGEAVGSVQRPGSVTAAIARRWIDGRRDKPFLFFLHLFEPHSPYEPPEPFRSRYAAAPYDGEIATADAIVGDFLGYLRSAGIYDRAIIVLMSDHGEGLMDHGEEEHGIFLYREEIHVPLLLKLPRSQFGGETVDAAAQLTDIVPTITALTGATTPPDCKGTSLLALRGSAKPRTIYSESMYPRIHLGWSALRSLTDAGDHYIEAPAPELYDMRADPGEKRNVLGEKRREYNALKTGLASFDSHFDAPAKIDPEEAKKLAALGYLGSSAGPSAGPLPDPKAHIADLNALKEGARLSARGDSAAAIAKFRAVLQANPNLTDAWQMLGETLESAGDDAGAIQAFQRAIAASPSLTPAFALRIASLDLELRKFADARAHAELAMASSPGAAHVMLARIALAGGNLAAARSALAQAGAGERGEAGVLEAQIAVAAGDLPGALTIIDRLRADVASGALAPRESLESTRGDILARMDRRTEAIAAFQDEIRRFPQNREAYAKLALVELLERRPSDAETTLVALVRANPGEGSVRYARKTIEGFAGLVDPATQRRWTEEVAGAARGKA